MVKISISLYIGNIYRPPKENTNEIIQTFTEELNSILTDLNKSNSIVLLTGDFNIDLLKLQDRQIIREYLECIISHGLCPVLTLPSRIAQNSATLIDNVFSNVHNKLSHNSGILETNISDHFPYF